MGWVYVFCFVNLKPEPSRRKYALFYGITLLEEIGMLVSWWLDASVRDDVDKPWYYYPAIPTVLGSFCLGMVFMFIYYKKFHPSGEMPMKRAQTAPF
jgi:hypothetical protein